MMQVLTVDEAIHALQEPLVRANYRLPVESVDIDCAYGRVLANTVQAQLAYPPFRRSAMDGIAVAFQEGTEVYRIVTSIGAGETFQGTLAPGEGIRIMTGAMVPDSADVVVVKEVLTWLSDTEVKVPNNIQVGQHILLPGEDIQVGQELVPANTVLEAAQVGLLAGQGVSAVSVYRKPRVIVLTTGREVTDPHETLPVGSIYNSNRYLLEGALRALGVEVVSLCHLSDAPEALEENIALLRHTVVSEGPVDMIISTGGVSVGDFDTMPALYEALGATTLYRRLQMRPGAASFGGVIVNGEQRTWCMGLSGNPTAAMNQFYLLVAPLLRALEGHGDGHGWMTCHMGEEIDKKHPLDRYIQGRIAYEDGKCWFYPNLGMTSGGILSLASANGLVKIDKNSDPITRGALVKVLHFSI